MLWLKGVASLPEKHKNDKQTAFIMLSIIWHQYNQTESSLFGSSIDNCDGNNSSQNTHEQISRPSNKKTLVAFISSVKNFQNCFAIFH